MSYLRNNNTNKDKTPPSNNTSSQQDTSLNLAKTAIKNLISNSFLFPKFDENILQKLTEVIVSPLTIVDLDLFLFSLPSKNYSNFDDDDLKDSSSNLDNKDIEFLNKLMKLSFQPENEYVNKFYVNYSNNYFLKVILLSNLYKIFIVNFISTPQIKYTSFDFLCSLSLICSDFPKKMVENINDFYCIMKSNSHTSTKEKSANFSEIVGTSLSDMTVFSNDIVISEYFLFFGVCFIHSNFLNLFKKVFIRFDIEPSQSINKNVEGLNSSKEVNENNLNTNEINNNESSPKSINNNQISYVEEMENLKTLKFLSLNNNSTGCSIKYDYQERTFKEILTENKLFNEEVEKVLLDNPDFQCLFYECLVLLNKDVYKSMESNSINTLNDVKELLGNSKNWLNFGMFLKAFCFNSKIINTIFRCDNDIYKVEKVIKKLGLVDN